jgi:sulfite exporter TauE/SafE
MIELPLVFLGGLLGSAHCVGMCGGFALLIGAPARRWSANLARQLVYSCGRIFTYCAFGGVVGYGGLRLAQGLGDFVNIQATIALLAGVLLVVQGLVSTGMIHYATRILHPAGAAQGAAATYVPAGAGCLMGGLAGAFLRDSRWSHVFLAGVFTGLLPCGLVYAYVALAASTSDLASGMLTMAAFGVGTVPMMVLAGSGSALFSLAGRRRLLRIAAWCVVLTGLVSMARGIGFLELPPGAPPASCPLCD